MKAEADPPPKPSVNLDQPLICGGCGFDLRAATAFQCPECGRSFNPKHLTRDLIPWEQRRHLGRIRAYALTLLLVTFRPDNIAEKVAKPMSLAAAKRFRQVTVVLAFLPLLAGAFALRRWTLVNSKQFSEFDWRNEWARLVISPWSFGIGVAGILIALSLASRAAVPFLALRKGDPARRVRALALAQYAAAPMAWTGIIVAIAWITALPVVPDAPDASRTIAAQLLHVSPTAWSPRPYVDALALRTANATLLSAGLLLLIWLVCTLRLLYRGRRASVARMCAAAVVLPVAWTLILVLVPLALEILVAWVVLVVLSFR